MNRLAAFLLIAASSATAFAADIGQHPAVFAPRALPAIDVSTFLVGHPAQGLPGPASHANFEHPALMTHLAGSEPHIDSNAFRVQPPATTRWQ